MFYGTRLAWKTARFAQNVKRIDDVPTLIKIGKKIIAEVMKSSDTAHAMLDRKPMTKQDRQKFGTALARLDMELKQLDIVIARVRELRSK